MLTRETLANQRLPLVKHPYPPTNRLCRVLVVTSDDDHSYAGIPTLLHGAFHFRTRGVLEENQRFN